MKFFSFLLTMGLIFSATAKASVQEQNLGPVIAVKRTYMVDMNQVAKNLKQDDINPKMFSAQIKEITKQEVLVGAKATEIIEGSSGKINVMFAANAQGYSVTASSFYDLTQEQTLAAIQEVYQKQNLNHESLSLTVLKVQ